MEIKYPKNIEPETKTFVEEVVKKLESVNAIESCDIGVVYMLILAYDMFAKTANTLYEDGALVCDKRGNKEENDASKVAYKWIDKALELMKQCGVTPWSRERIRAMTPEVDEDNEIMKFIRGE